MTTSSSGDVVRFGLFELNLQAGQLSRNGIRIRLAQQPLQLLSILLERHGTVVTREELRQRLWGTDVFVDFDHGLNKSIQKIREALGDSADSPRYVETIPRTGYRFIAPVQSSAGIADAVSPSEGLLISAEISAAMTPEPEIALRPGPKLSRPLARTAILTVAVLVAILVAGVLLWAGYLRAHRLEPIRSLAVLPLDNLSGDSTQEYFVDGMTDELITELARIPSLRVVSRTSVMQYKKLHKPLAQIARELNVDAIVEGSVVRSGDKVRITAQLIDTRTDKHLWAESFESQTGDVVSLQDSVAREIAAQARVALMPAGEKDQRDASHVNPAAHDAVLRGRYFLQKRDARQAATYFQQAISLDPIYAPAYSGLALALQSQAALEMMPSEEAMRQGLNYAHRAVELDPQDGPSYTALGGIQFLLEWNWAPAGQNLARGVALSPNDSFAELQYAGYLDAMNRPDEAVTHMRRALELDPLSFFINRQLASTLYFDRRYDEALFYLQRAREMEPGRPALVEEWASWIYEKKGMQDEAVSADLSILHSPDPKNAETFRAIYKHQGWAAYWAARAAELKPRAGMMCSDWELGKDYARAGDSRHAFESLDQAVDHRCYWMIWLRVDPTFDGLRDDPRYAALLARMKLPG